MVYMLADGYAGGQRGRKIYHGMDPHTHCTWTWKRKAITFQIQRKQSWYVGTGDGLCSLAPIAGIGGGMHWSGVFSPLLTPIRSGDCRYVFIYYLRPYDVSVQIKWFLQWIRFVNNWIGSKIFDRSLPFQTWRVTFSLSRQELECDQARVTW